MAVKSKVYAKKISLMTGVFEKMTPTKIWITFLILIQFWLFFQEVKLTC